MTCFRIKFSFIHHILLFFWGGKSVKVEWYTVKWGFSSRSHKKISLPTKRIHMLAFFCLLLYSLVSLSFMKMNLLSSTFLEEELWLSSLPAPHITSQQHKHLPLVLKINSTVSQKIGLTVKIYHLPLVQQMYSWLRICKLSKFMICSVNFCWTRGKWQILPVRPNFFFFVCKLL